MADLQMMMTALNQNLPEIQAMIRGLAFTTGIILFTKVMFKLRRAADYRSMMYQPTELIGPMVGIFISIVLIYAAAFMQLSANTLFDRSQLLSLDFNTHAAFSNNQAVATAVFMTLKTVGMIAFIRGWVLLLRATDQGSAGQGLVGKGIMHIISGVLAFHFWWTVQVLAGTFGIAPEVLGIFGQDVSIPSILSN